jgi:hypothetical protein
MGSSRLIYVNVDCCQQIMVADTSTFPSNEENTLSACKWALICGLIYSYTLGMTCTYFVQICCDSIAFALRFPMQARPPIEDGERSNHGSFTLAQSSSLAASTRTAM